MGIATEIIENLLGSAERSLGIDHPANGAQRPQAGGEDGWRGQAGQIAEEPELAGIECRLEGMAPDFRDALDRRELDAVSVGLTRTELGRLLAGGVVRDEAERPAALVFVRLRDA